MEDINLVKKRIESFSPSIFMMDYDRCNKTLATLLNIVVRNIGEPTKKPMFLAIIEQFDNEDDFIPMSTKIWIIKRMNKETLKYMQLAYDYSFSSYLIDLAKYETFPKEKDSIVTIDEAINRLVSIFDIPSSNELINLRFIIQSARNEGGYINNTVSDYIDTTLIKNYNTDINSIVIASIPEYITDFGYGKNNDILLRKALTLLYKTNILTSNGYQLAYDIAKEIPDSEVTLKDGNGMNMRDYVYRNIIISTPYELKISIANTKQEQSQCDTFNGDEEVPTFDPIDIEELENLATIFIQLLGPTNPFSSIMTKDTNEDVDRLYDRMFTCVSYENGIEDDLGEREEDEPNDIYSWFTGVCMHCSLSILKPWYAVRAPVVPGGGWAGCYCSWKCIKNDMDNITPDMSSYINRFEQQLLNYGVHDRNWIG